MWWVTLPFRAPAAIAYNKDEREVSLIRAVYHIGQPTVNIQLQELAMQARDT